jgi:hypothetical protein
MQWLKCHPIPVITVGIHSLLVGLIWQAVASSNDPEAGMAWVLFEMFDWPASMLFNWDSVVGPKAVANILVLGGLQCQASNGVGIDISLGGLPYEQRVIERASPHTFAPRKKWITASAEDMVILKAFADRDQDWIDVKGILRRQLPNLNWRCIVTELRELTELKEDETILPRLEAMRRQVEKEIEECDLGE